MESLYGLKFYYGNDLERSFRKGFEDHTYGRYDTTKDEMTKILESDPNNARAWYLRGSACYALGEKKVNQDSIDHGQHDFKESIEYFQRSIESDEKNDSAWIGMGGALYQMGRIEFKQGLIAEARNDFMASLQCSNRIIEKDTNNFKALFSKGLLCYQLAKLELRLAQTNAQKLRAISFLNESLNCFCLAIRLKPNDAEAWMGKGNSFYDLKMYGDALDCFSEAIRIEPYKDEAWYHKGLCLHNLKRYNEAIDCYMRSLSIQSDDDCPQRTCNIINDCGNAFYNLGMYEEAAKKYSEAINKYEENIKGSNYNILFKQQYLYITNQAWSLVSLNRDKEAAKLLKDKILVEHQDKLVKQIDVNKAGSNLDCTTNIIRALYLRGFICYKQENHKKAIELIDESIEMCSIYDIEDHYPYYFMGLVHQKIKKNDDAIKYFEESLEINDKFAEAHVALAKSHLNNGYNERALKEVRKAMNINPTLTSAQELLSKFDSTSSSEGLKFIKYWSSTRGKKILALMLVASLIILAIPVPYIPIDKKDMKDQFVIVLMSVIVLILLLPDIAKARIGPVEIDRAIDQPGTKVSLDLQGTSIPLKP